MEGRTNWHGRFKSEDAARAKLAHIAAILGMPIEDTGEYWRDVNHCHRLSINRAAVQVAHAITREVPNVNATAITRADSLRDVARKLELRQRASGDTPRDIRITRGSHAWQVSGSGFSERAREAILARLSELVRAGWRVSLHSNGRPYHIARADGAGYVASSYSDGAVSVGVSADAAKLDAVAAVAAFIVGGSRPQFWHDHPHAIEARRRAEFNAALDAMDTADGKRAARAVATFIMAGTDAIELAKVPAPYSVACLHSGTEDGALWYVTRNGAKLDADSPYNGGCIYRADAIAGAIELAKLVARYASDWARDCEWLDLDIDSDEDAARLSDSFWIRNASRHYDGGIAALESDAVTDAADWCDCGTVTGASGGYVKHEPGAPGCESAPNPTHPIPGSVTADAILARHAKDAADAFTFDPDSEDADTAAMRAVDIMRDLAREDRAAFILRVFGMPQDERHACRELASIERSGMPLAPSAWQYTRKQARIERGMPDVARELACHYREDITRLAFEGHEATGEYGESTNLAAWREACAAFDAVNATAFHTFGGMALDGYQGDLDKLARVALDAACDAVSWAAFNEAHTDTGAPVGIEPRGE
jgi:hypothetical protein